MSNKIYGIIKQSSLSPYINLIRPNFFSRHTPQIISFVALGKCAKVGITMHPLYDIVSGHIGIRKRISYDQNGLHINEVRIYSQLLLLVGYNTQSMKCILWCHPQKKVMSPCTIKWEHHTNLSLVANQASNLSFQPNQFHNAITWKSHISQFKHHRVAETLYDRHFIKDLILAYSKPTYSILMLKYISCSPFER